MFTRPSQGSNKNFPKGRLRAHISNNGADFEHDPVRELLAAAKRKLKAYRLLLQCPPKTYRPRLPINFPSRPSQVWANGFWIDKVVA